MDRMTPEQMIEVIQAYIDGKQIQYDDYGEWRDNHNMPLFNFYETVYRIKPEPRVRYIAEDKKGNLSWVSETTITEAMAGRSMEQWPKVVKFIEVIE